MNPVSSQIKTDFGMSVKRRRNFLGISQEELAARSGLHRTYISDIERGFRNVSLLNIVKIAEALDTTPSEILAFLSCPASPEVG